MEEAREADLARLAASEAALGVRLDQCERELCNAQAAGKAAVGEKQRATEDTEQALRNLAQKVARIYVFFASVLGGGGNKLRDAKNQ